MDITQTRNTPAERISKKTYFRELKHLQAELVALQRWVVEKGMKVCIIFEGRDGAGKGGVIKAITERTNPRIFRVEALPAPTEREKSQLYLQRYFSKLPAAGEIVIFDRSWYNRAGVERVMGFCTEEEAKKFLDTVPFFGKSLGGKRHYLVEILVGSGHGRAGAPPQRAHQRRAQSVEALADGFGILPPLV